MSKAAQPPENPVYSAHSMRTTLLETGLPLIAALLGLLLLGHWLWDAHAAERPALRSAIPPPPVTAPPAPASTSVAPPVTPQAAISHPATPAPTAATPAPTTVTSAVPGNVAELPGAWPQFRGSTGDGVSPESTPLARAFGAGGPKRLWQVTLGEGYAGPVVWKSRVYLLDYDVDAQSDVLRCFALADGRELWKLAYASPVGKQHGISRTTPSVTERFIVTLGPRCHVLCADTKSGRKLWLRDLVKDYGTTVPEWNAGQCPLIDRDRAIIATGGSALLVAFDGATGKELWHSPNPGGWKMTHSTILPFTLGGKRLYVYCGSRGVAAVSAEDGKILWQTTDWVVPTANIPKPVLVGQDQLLFSGGYGAGATLMQFTLVNGQVQAETRWRVKESVFGSYQQTPIYYRGYIYAVIPKGEMVCLDPATGAVRWSSGSTNRFAWNPYLLAGGVLYVLNDAGELALIDATPDAYRPLAKVAVLPGGREFWAPMALAGRRLLLRDLTRMVCLDVGR
jgi:outer membrane protein assembly factor BamB